MTVYKAPLRDFSFVLNEFLDAGELGSLPGYEEATPDAVAAVLEEAAKICEEVVFPLNRSGDEEGCHFEAGGVRTPRGFQEAYRLFRGGGWTALACTPEFGGQGLPETVSFCVMEMLCSANLAFGMYPGLSNGAYRALLLHGTPEQKRLYLPPLIDGSWTGTMCLTEPHCGTDLALLRSRAEPAGEGKYRITGTKIFISAGEHDLTPNILHLVLARLPDAPEGIRGLSLFLVPKFLVGSDGSLGPRNAVQCGSIEHKMGIRASSTCVMNFDGAEACLIGAPHGGMRCMFTMMNYARLGVAIQGLGIAETAWQYARAYAGERLQGRSLSGPKHPELPADPILVHPDVRRMLLTQKANAEAGRALACWIAVEIDIAERHPDPLRRAEAEDFVALMTPVVKAHFTDCGFEAANLAVQVLGGHGYIRENGVEQLVRDARITQIYEGTNGVQGLDLVGRKLASHNGRLLRRFFHPLDAFIAANGAQPGMQEFVQPLAKAAGRLQQATMLIAERGLKDPEEAGAVASDYLKLFALTAFAFVWARMAKVSLDRMAGEDGAFYAGKLATARFYMTRILPQTSSLFAMIGAGAGPVMAPPL